jgi:hypothetical protein
VVDADGDLLNHFDGFDRNKDNPDCGEFERGKAVEFGDGRLVGGIVV